MASFTALPLWLIRIISVFPVSGLVGGDHFAVGSNISGAIKALANVLTLGGWYFYDVVYVLSSDDVVNKGFSVPFFENFEFAKGAVTKTLNPGMAQVVGTIAKAMFILIMFSVAVFSWISYSSSSGMWQNLFIALGSISGCIGLLMLMQVGWSFYSSFKTGVMSAAAAATAGLPLGLTSIMNLKKTNNNSNTAENDPKEPSTPAKDPSPSAKNSSTPAENDPKEPSPSAQTGGGGRKSLQAIAEEILVQRKTDEMPTESLVFIGILVAVALGGITYAVFKYQKQSKVKKEDEDASDTDGV